MPGLHFRQQRILNKAVQAIPEIGEIVTVDGPEFPVNLGAGGDDIMRHAAPDAADIHAGIGRGEGAVIRGAGFHLLPQGNQFHDIAGGVFGGVDPAFGVGAMPGLASETGGVFAASLMPFNHLHFGWLPDNSHGRAIAAPMQFRDHVLRPEAAGFLIMGEGKMERPGQGLIFHVPGESKAGGDKTLHVGCPPAIEQAVLLSHAERIMRPVLVSDRDNIAMPRQDDPAIGIRGAIIGGHCGKQVRLGAGGILHDLNPCAAILQPSRHIVDHGHVAVGGNRRAGDQVIKDANSLLKRCFIEAGHFGAAFVISRTSSGAGGRKFLPGLFP